MADIIDSGLPEISDSEKHALYKGTIKPFKDIIKYLPAEYVKTLSDEGLINDVAKRVKDTVGRNGVGFPRICNQSCEIQDSCPFFKTGKIPEDYPCPLELYMVNTIIGNLEDQLLQDNGEVTMSDQIMLTSIAMLYVIGNFRTSAILSRDGLKVIGTIRTSSGPIEIEVPNPLLEQYVTINDQLMSFLKEIHSTRLSRARVKPTKVVKEKEETVIDMDTLMGQLSDLGVPIEKITEIITNTTTRKSK